MSMNLLMAETLRYLGVGNAVPDEALAALTERGITRVQAASVKRCLVKRFPCRCENNTVTIGLQRIQSADLSKHLAGCDGAYLFAATLGADVDRLLRRDTVLQPSLAVVEQAAAAAVLEAYCDETCRHLESTLHGEYLRPRFSAGYGDMPLQTQVPILHMLQAQKQIGLSCTHTFMLTPIKSVTAVIGISTEQSRCFSNGCDRCQKVDCAFRKK